MRWPSTSTHSATPPFIVTARGWAPPMPPRPAVSVIVPGQRAAEAAAGDLGEALVGPLQDPLRADVDPRAGRHLPVHREAELLEPAELVPRPPLGYQVRVGDEHPRRPLVGAEDTDRLARLHEHRLVVAQALERADHGVERVPRAGGPAGAAVDDEVVRPLGHLRVEVVHQHPHRCFLGPAPAAQLAPPRRPHRPRSTRHVAPPRPSYVHVRAGDRPVPESRT